MPVHTYTCACTYVNLKAVYNVLVHVVANVLRCVLAISLVMFMYMYMYMKKFMVGPDKTAISRDNGCFEPVSSNQ